MIKYRVATIINYSSNEKRFLKAAIEGVSSFSEQIFIVACDHFFDETKENINLLAKHAKDFPECNFIVYPYLNKLKKKKIYKKIGQSNFWHSLSRLVGFCSVSSQVEFLLFLDVDEIIDSNAFEMWLQKQEHKEYDVMKLASYWYFRSALYRSKTLEDSPIFARKDKLSSSILLHKEERDAIYNLMEGRKKRMTKGISNEPLAHHYSWVRTKKEMLKKVTSWGHKNDAENLEKPGSDGLPYQ